MGSRSTQTGQERHNNWPQSMGLYLGLQPDSHYVNKRQKTVKKSQKALQISSGGQRKSSKDKSEECEVFYVLCFDIFEREKIFVRSLPFFLDGIIKFNFNPVIFYLH